MPNRARHARGFTLVELMVAVAIIGILSSIAIPTFRDMQLRSKQTERAIMVTSIKRAIEDYWARESTFPWDLGGGTYYMYLNYANPAGTAGTTKRQWRRVPLNAYDHWNRLSLLVEGDVYFTYQGYGITYPGVRYWYIDSYSDLDGNRVNDDVWQYWYYTRDRLERWAGGNWSCSDCTYAWRTPASGREF